MLQQKIKFCTCGDSYKKVVQMLNLIDVELERAEDSANLVDLNFKLREEIEALEQQL